MPTGEHRDGRPCGLLAPSWLQHDVRSVLVISIRKISKSQNRCLFSLQHALWKFKSPSGWCHFSRLSVVKQFDWTWCEIIWDRATSHHVMSHALYTRWPYHQENPHIRDSRILAPVRPRTQAAGLQSLQLQIAAAFPDPQTRAFPGTEHSRITQSPNIQGEPLV